MFWPMLRPELVVYILDSLLDNKVPFVFAHSAELAQTMQLDHAVLERINASEDACLVKFAPQVICVWRTQ